MTENPQPIDNGDRYRIRADAPSFDASLDVLDALLERCPPHCYPLRATVRKSSHGARCHVEVVFQARGRPLESVASRAQRQQRRNSD